MLNNFTIYNESLSNSDMIEITTNFDKMDSRIVFIEEMNNSFDGTITGTEQYTLLQEGTEDETLTYQQNGNHKQFLP